VARESDARHDGAEELWSFLARDADSSIHRILRVLMVVVFIASLIWHVIRDHCS
jgi:hypothetical protein